MGIKPGNIVAYGIDHLALAGNLCIEHHEIFQSSLHATLQLGLFLDVGSPLLSQPIFLLLESRNRRLRLSGRGLALGGSLLLGGSLAAWCSCFPHRHGRLALARPAFLCGKRKTSDKHEKQEYGLFHRF